MKGRGLAVLLLVALSGCFGVDRPEGVVEDWLRAINFGEAGEPEIYADLALADEILPDRSEPDGLDVLEVGVGAEDQGRARVPYRIRRVGEQDFFGVANLELTEAGWRIVGLGPSDPSLRVPSDDGPRLGKASSLAWLGALAAAVAMVVLTALVMAAAPRPVTPPSPDG